ncbi:MAG TPA: flagellar hook-associated protein FlgK [Gaiellaceae bacterium]|jgi:flagellar hook-associated protein 1 FlgK|nr:flagellar hook-associated protein FlgK [Gaiellaceae bacterium]
MSTTFLGLETALRGLLADQRSLDTTGHNIANAQTPGYSRQVAELATTPAFNDVGAGQLGTGVDVVQYQRIRDSFLDTQLRAQTMRQGSAEAQESGLSNIEQTLSEPSDNGLSELLGKYWAAWQNVANNPSDLATRQALAQSAASLTNGFNTLSTELSTIQSQTTQNETLTMQQVNSLGSQVASLNQSIQAAELAGQQPNDLLDSRDNLIDQLSALGNTSTSVSSGTAGQLGQIDVTFGGESLVAATTANTLTLPLTNVTSGQLAGMDQVISLISDPTNGYLAKLNGLASALASATNTQSAAGKDLNGNAGVPFFTVTSGSEAATISVSAAVLASPDLIAASTNGDPGDGSNALALGNLQQSALVGGATIDTAYSQLVTQIGSDSQQAQANLSNANSLVESLTNQRTSVSGVSLDEEMTNLLQFQRGYQACARVMSAMDSMIDTLVNHTGTVGL